MKTTMVVTFDIELNHNPGADLQKAIDEMDYSFDMDEKDVEICRTEIVDVSGGI